MISEISLATCSKEKPCSRAQNPKWVRVTGFLAKQGCTHTKLRKSEKKNFPPTGNKNPTAFLSPSLLSQPPLPSSYSSNFLCFNPSLPSPSISLYTYSLWKESTTERSVLILVRHPAISPHFAFSFREVLVRRTDMFSSVAI